jgi:hypothetical protein
VAVVRESDQPFERRAADWDLTSLPVPAEVLVYAEGEWRRGAWTSISLDG